jgi:hypothetical protein
MKDEGERMKDEGGEKREDEGVGARGMGLCRSIAQNRVRLILHPSAFILSRR